MPQKVREGLEQSGTTKRQIKRYTGSFSSVLKTFNEEEYDTLAVNLKYSFFTSHLVIFIILSGIRASLVVENWPTPMN